MRMNARSSRALRTGFLFAVSAATVWGCATANSQTPPTKKEVKAFVTWDGNKSELTHFPKHKDAKRAQLSEGGMDTISWCSPHGEVKFVSWSGRSPFDKDPWVDKETGCLMAGPPKNGSSKVTAEGKCKTVDGDKGECYVYTIKLRLKNGDLKDIDPRIEIVP